MFALWYLFNLGDDMDLRQTHPDYGEAELEALLERAADGDPEANEVLQRIAVQALGEIVDG